MGYMVEDMTDAQLLDKLARKYERTSPEACEVCGGSLSIQHRGGGLPLNWACTRAKETLDAATVAGDEPARIAARDHFDRSRWTDFRAVGDARVMELIRRYRMMQDRLSAKDAAKVGQVEEAEVVGV